LPCRQNQSQAVKKPRSTSYSPWSGDDDADCWIGKSSTHTSEVSARENFCPLNVYVARDCQHTPSANIVNGVFEIFGENFARFGAQEEYSRRENLQTWSCG
jgi:hypothetical protein